MIAKHNHSFYMLLFVCTYALMDTYDISVFNFKNNTDGVTIQEVNGRPLSLNLTQSSQEVSWTFQITTNVSK